MEELFTRSAGRWAIVVSKVEPGTLEHQQGARHAVTIYCDEKPIVVYAYTAIRRGEGACVEDIIDEGPDLVDFVLSERDLESLELLLGRAHQLVRDLRNNAPGPEDSKVARHAGEEISEVGHSVRRAGVTGEVALSFP